MINIDGAALRASSNLKRSRVHSPLLAAGLVLSLVLSAAACAATQVEDRPAQFAYSRFLQMEGKDDLAHLPFADIRRISANDIVATYGLSRLRRWSREGDPIAAYALANHIAGADVADELSGERISPAALELYQRAANPTCAELFVSQVRGFAGCDTGLPEAQYAIGLFCERQGNVPALCSAGARAWFEKAARNGFYFAAAKL